VVIQRAYRRRFRRRAAAAVVLQTGVRAFQARSHYQKVLRACLCIQVGASLRAATSPVQGRMTHYKSESFSGNVRLPITSWN
jgi:hypothetical protein